MPARARPDVLIQLLDGYEGSFAVSARIYAPQIEVLPSIDISFEAPNHYLKLTARENLQLLAGLHGGGTEDPNALLERVGLEQTATVRRRVLKGYARPADVARALRARPRLLFWTNRPRGSTR